MAKFSLARIPYYISVAVFMVIVAFVSYFNNTQVVGIESDIYLAMIVVSAGLALLSLNYMFFAKGGDNDEVDTDIAGVTLSKKYYYFAVLGVAGWRAIVGYQLNHGGTGIESTYGIIWLLASAALALFTWANYRSYAARTV